MTLQQKLLAKQSKKGFTLVELVVVIAILGILAAIAIPAVVGIINSANKSSGDSDAATLNNELSTYYAGIKTGSINKNDTGTNGKVKATPDATELAKLDANSSNTTRKTAAKKCTVAGCLQYAGLEDALKNKVSGNDFVFVKGKTTVYYTESDKKPATGTTALALTTTMSDLGFD